MNWPENADGDVFRKLAAQNFDFDKQYTIDFKVDFSSWPPPASAIESLKAEYPNLKVVDVADGTNSPSEKGYITLKINDTVNYDLVAETQSKVTRIMKPFGGWCYSWGVIVD